MIFLFLLRLSYGPLTEVFVFNLIKINFYSGEEERNEDTEDIALPGTEGGVCETTEWNEWSECSASCGVGLKMRTRRFKDRMGRKKCPHVSIVEKIKCMEPACAAGTEEVIDPTCKVYRSNDEKQYKFGDLKAQHIFMSPGAKIDVFRTRA